MTIVELPLWQKREIAKDNLDHKDYRYIIDNNAEITIYIAEDRAYYMDYTGNPYNCIEL